jgi:hypothetical protein
MRITLCVSFAGSLGPYDSPRIGDVVEVSDDLAAALCADGRAIRVEPLIEDALGEPGPERAVKQRNRRTPRA